MKDTASAQVLKNVVPGATLKNFTTPKEALDAFYAGGVSTPGAAPVAGRQQPHRQDGTAALPPLRPLRISCIVNQNNGKLLSSTNIALGQMMQAYMEAA